MTSEHLRVILDSENDSDAFTAFARTLAVGDVPHEIMKAIRLGRMTALRKPDGGVRGIVVGDFCVDWLPARQPSNSPRRFWRPQPTSSLPLDESRN